MLMDTEVDGSIPIYRFFNSTTGAHFYTPSATERDAVLELAGLSVRRYCLLCLTTRYRDLIILLLIAIATK